MDKAAFQGRILHVMPAVSRKGRPEDEEGAEGRKKNLKDSRLQKSKDVAGKDFNWAMLYMNVRISLGHLLVSMLGIVKLILVLTVPFVGMLL